VSLVDSPFETMVMATATVAVTAGAADGFRAGCCLLCPVSTETLLELSTAASHCGVLVTLYPYITARELG
jgi:hypothetical protein